MLRRPPEFEDDLVQEEASIEEGPDEGAGLKGWSNLCETTQNYYIQLWLSTPHPSLSEFCACNGLNYRSIHSAFAVRRVPSAPVVKAMTEADRIRRTTDRAAGGAELWAKLNELLAHRLIDRLSGFDAMSLDELQKQAAHAVEMLDSVSKAVKTLGSVSRADSLVTNTEVTVRRGSALIPPDIRERLLEKVLGVAEHAVRAADGAST